MDTASWLYVDYLPWGFLNIDFDSEFKLQALDCPDGITQCMKSGPKLGGEFIFDWLILIYEKLRLKFVFQILLPTNLVAVVNMKPIMKDVPLCIYWVKATWLLATALETNVLQPTLQTILEHKSPLVSQSLWLFSTKSWLEWSAPS